MTNNTQLLNCPFCGTDDVDPTGVLNGDETRSPECMGCGATAPTLATWNCRIAAPAEDVRAVVEEPVLWVLFYRGGNKGPAVFIPGFAQTDKESAEKVAAQDLGHPEVMPLYRRSTAARSARSCCRSAKKSQSSTHTVRAGTPAWMRSRS